MDKFEAWKELRFDVMFHGSEWKGTYLYNEYEKSLLKWGWILSSWNLRQV